MKYLYYFIIITILFIVYVEYSVGGILFRLNSLGKTGLMPLKISQADNPYVTAFWKWWPEMYKNLEVFRMTGGEPLMWDMTSLTNGLKSKNKIIHIETSGAYKLTGNWDWICLSPKKRMNPLAEFYNVANELKVIVYNKDDLKFAEEQAKMVNSDAHLYLQPEWDNREKMMPIMVDYVKNNPKWKISLQTHKYLNIP